MKISAHGYKLTVILGSVIFMLALIFACDGKNKHEDAVQYQCPMHPTYISDKPGSCPICGMDLVPIEQSKPESSEKNKNKQPLSTERKILFYRNPMDPSISSPVPAKDEMGMEYIPV